MISEGDFTAVQTIAKQVKGPKSPAWRGACPRILTPPARRETAGKRGASMFSRHFKIHREHKLGKLRTKSSGWL